MGRMCRAPEEPRDNVRMLDSGDADAEGVTIAIAGCGCTGARCRCVEGEKRGHGGFLLRRRYLVMRRAARCEGPHTLRAQSSWAPKLPGGVYLRRTSGSMQCGSGVAWRESTGGDTLLETHSLRVAASLAKMAHALDYFFQTRILPPPHPPAGDQVLGAPLALAAQRDAAPNLGGFLQQAGQQRYMAWWGKAGRAAGWYTCLAGGDGWMLEMRQAGASVRQGAQRAFCSCLQLRCCPSQPAPSTPSACSGRRQSSWGCWGSTGSARSATTAPLCRTGRPAVADRKHRTEHQFRTQPHVMVWAAARSP